MQTQYEISLSGWNETTDRQIDALVYELSGMTGEEIQIVEGFMKDEGLETMNISFLRGHLVQLTQSISQFALKPGEEETKKKGCWQFWWRG